MPSKRGANYWIGGILLAGIALVVVSVLFCLAWLHARREQDRIYYEEERRATERHDNPK